MNELRRDNTCPAVLLDESTTNFATNRRQFLPQPFSAADT